MKTDKSALRTLDIYLRFSRGEKLKTVDLADDYNMSTRQITRDIKAINSYINNKIIFNKSTSYWSYEDDSGSVLLTDEEQLTLNILDQACIEQGDDFHKSALKLFSKFKDALHNTIYNNIDSEDIESIKHELALADKAIYNKNKINLVYHGENKKVDPLKLTNFEGYWYLVINDHKDNRIKTLYFKDIESFSILDEKYTDIDVSIERILKNAINTYFETDVTPYEVKLYIAAEKAHIFQRKPISPSQRVIQEYSDGSYDIAIEITHDMAIIPKIQQFIPHIRIFEDDEHGKRIVNKIQNNLNQFNK